MTLETFNTLDDAAKFAATMNEFAETVAALGENKRLEDLRCKP